jgi:sulfur transfer complex TusBCD TusB component (DsrH family)
MEDKKDLKEYRKQWFADMEQKLRENQTEEDSLFYYHSSEDRIVLSHAIFWTLTQPQYFKSKIRKEKIFLLLRQYEEEMLDAFLMEEEMRV